MCMCGPFLLKLSVMCMCSVVQTWKCELDKWPVMPPPSALSILHHVSNVSNKALIWVLPHEAILLRGVLYMHVMYTVHS